MGCLQPGEVLQYSEGGLGEASKFNQGCLEPAEKEGGATRLRDAPPNKVRVATISVERKKQLLAAARLDEVDVTPEQHTQLLSLLEEYVYTFALDPSELGYTDLVNHSIDTNGHLPIQQPPHRIPFALKEKVEEMVRAFWFSKPLGTFL